MDDNVLIQTAKKTIFGGKLTQAQIDGIHEIVDGWDMYGYGLDTALAYILATPTWETGKRMVPVRETFATSSKQAISRLDTAFKKGQMKWVKTPYWRTGFFGRGLVQITHEANYAGPLRDAVLKEFPGCDIHADPELALRSDIAVFILIDGVTRGVTLKPDFTAYALEDFINEKKTDYNNARKTVNPGEKDSYVPIGDLARKWEDAIRAAREADGETFRGPGTNLYDGRFHGEIKQVQKRLADLKYDVGRVDGVWGDRTAGAVLAFRRKNDLPLKPDNITDKDFLAALVTGEPVAVSAERQTATVADLRAEGSKTVTGSDKQQWMGFAGVGMGGLAGVNKALDQADQYNAVLQRIADVTNPIIGFIQTNFWIFLAGIGGVVAYQAYKIKKNAVEAHRVGKDPA
jgi:peptidoglycan hydrolase-like protein with peptidoglycan-binding domain